MARTQLMSQDWYRVASLRPAIRSQIEVSLHDYLGRNWFVLFNRSSGKSVRVPSGDYDILRRFDGTATLDTIWNDLAWSGQKDLPPQDEFIELVSRLYEGGIIAMDALPRTATLARMQAEQGREWLTRFLRSPVSQKVPLANPARLLRTPLMTGLAHLLFSRLGLALWILLIAAGILTAIENWSALTENLSDRALAPSNLVILVLVYPVVKLLHELGHALAVRRFGGDVNQVGVMFLVFVPMPYVDASEVNRFRSHSSRAIVTLAGIFAEFAIGAAAILLWAESEPGLWRAILFNTVFICTVSTLFFNGNPLLKFDAYYALADLTQTPGLGTRGQKLNERLGKRILGISAGPDVETAGPGGRLWMSSYAFASVLYRIFITFSIALLVAGMVPYVGQVLAVWILIGGLVYPNAKGLYDLATSSAVAARKRTAIWRSVLIGSALVLLLAVVPAPSRTTVTGVVANGERAAVYAEVEGRVDALFVETGAQLSQGDALVVLSPERISIEARALDARVAAATAKLRGSSGDARAGLSEAIRRELDALEQSRAEMNARIALAQIRAHGAGTWMPETPKLRLGQFVTRGQRIGWIDAPGARRLVAQLPETARRRIDRGVTGAQVLFEPGDIELVSTEDLTILPNATRTLSDDRLANRFGGPVLTEGADDPSGYRAVSPGFPLEVQLDLAQRAVGQHVQIKLEHPPEPILMQIWPRIVSVFTSRFGPRV